MTVAMQWLQRFEYAVNAKDYNAAMILCSPGVYAFGTVANAVQGSSYLVSQQYEKMWPHIVSFSFLASAVWQGCGLVVIAVLWKSTNWRRNWLGRRIEYERTGRATIALKQGLAIHTHFSVTP